MCLNKIIKRNNFEKRKYAYKVFNIISLKQKRYSGEIYNQEKEYVCKKWYLSKSIKIRFLDRNFNSNSYISGFHCFTRKEDAIKYLKDSHSPQFRKEYVVKRVEIEEILVEGKQNNFPVIVVRKIKIL